MSSKLRGPLYFRNSLAKWSSFLRPSKKNESRKRWRHGFFKAGAVGQLTGLVTPPHTWLLVLHHAGEMPRNQPLFVPIRRLVVRGS
jgi:hypothetical protein